METDEYHPKTLAPHTGIFEEIDVFGTTTGAAAFVREGEPFPGAPRGFMWRMLGKLPIAELRYRAEEFRRMATTAGTTRAVEGLLRLSERFDALADQRGHEDH